MRGAKTLGYVLVLALVLGLLFPAIQLKADTTSKTYVLDSEAEDLNLAAYGKKDRITDGNYGTDGYFLLAGQNIRANSDTLIIELAKREGSSISFTVTGAATLALSVASNGSSNKSDGILISLDTGEEIVPNGYEKSIFTVEGSDPTTVWYMNLPAGSYKFRSPEGSNNDNRGIRLFTATVTEYPDGNIPERTAFNDVSAPKLAGIEQDDEKIVVTYDADISFDGGDFVKIEMFNEAGEVADSTEISTEGKQAVAEFVPQGSGKYTFKATLGRYGEEGKESAVSDVFDFLMPLKEFAKFTVTNIGGGSVILEWSEIPEADVYQIVLNYEGSDGDFLGTFGKDTLSFVVNGLTIDKEYTFSVSALAPGRDNDNLRYSRTSVTKIVRDRVDRAWTFAYFGQSVNGSRNIIEDLNEDAFTFKLKSCTFNEDGSIKDKGGKFTSFYDGISYYYTEIDAAKENFELTATFTIDYINPTPDGQEGFGLIIRDSIGENGVSSKNFETNSASIIATKFEATYDGTKYSMKDGLGVRFTYGLTEKNIADGTMSTYGVCKTTPCQYDSGNLINAGDTYTLTIKKTNTGYHCIYNGEEYILYGVDKLLQIDPEHVYVGFAVARGCNVTVSDVTFTTSDPATDPAAEPEPEPVFNVGVSIVSPDTSGTLDYILRFRANADGTAYITDALGNVLVENLRCKVNEIVETVVPIKEGSNNITVNFKALTGYLNPLGEKCDTYGTVTKSVLVNVRQYENEVFYVAPGAAGSGAGTKEDPIDLNVALSFVLPGQKIILMDGTYDMTYQLKIVKGNSGNAEAYKYMIADEGAHPIFSFANSKNGGFVNWGDYWYFEGFDVCNTQDNIKGFQMAGNNCVAVNINTYNNGDTGFQISGSSNDPKAEWPKNNTIINCTSHDNSDSAMNNADGFAAKLSVGEGNTFIGCISYNNIDDGWDLYAKVETGAIGAVTIINCVAYNNGFLSDGTGFGDGNGFKLGGDGISVPHVLKNCVAFGNHNVGITSNSDPSVQVYNCTTFGNTAAGIALYGKGDTERNFVLDGIISMNNGSSDNLKEQDLTSEKNYLQSGSGAKNSAGTEVTADIFVSTDMTVAPARYENGSINMNGLLEIKADAVVKENGAVISEASNISEEIAKIVPVVEKEEDPTPTEAESTPTPTITQGEKPAGGKGTNKTLLVVIAVVAGALLLCGLTFLLVKRYMKKKKQ